MLHRALPALTLSLALLLSACGGADGPADGAADTEVETTAATATTATAAATATAEATATAQQVTAEDIQGAVDEADTQVFCDSILAFRVAFNDFNVAEVGSEEEAGAVAIMTQLGADVEALTGESLPQVGASLEVVRAAAQAFLDGNGSSEATPEGDAAAATVVSVSESCAELGL